MLPDKALPRRFKYVDLQDLGIEEARALQMYMHRNNIVQVLLPGDGVHIFGCEYNHYLNFRKEMEEFLSDADNIDQVEKIKNADKPHG